MSSKVVNENTIHKSRKSSELLTELSDSLTQRHNPTVSGRFIATRELLSGTTEVEDLICEMKEMLTDKHESRGNGFNERLLELWMVAERCLLQEEIDELRPSVFKRLFGENRTKIRLSRDGRQQLGGY
jgi:hypothetical protein